MSADVKLAGRLPGSFDNNGMYNVHTELLETPERPRLAVIWYDVPKIVDDIETGDRTPTVRVLRIEPMGDVGDATETLRQMVLEAAEKRTGKTPLPFDQVDPTDQSPPELLGGED